MPLFALPLSAMPVLALPLPAIDPVAVQLGPFADPLVCPRLHRRPDRRLVLRAAAGPQRAALGRRAAPHPRPHRRHDRLGGARGRAGRAGRLRPVLQFRGIPRRPPRDAGHLARRHVLSRRPARRHPGDPPVRTEARAQRPRHARPRRRGDADRPVLRPHRQFHQRRAVGPPGAGFPIRGRVPGRRDRSRATRASSTRPLPKGSSCSPSWPSRCNGSVSAGPA